ARPHRSAWPASGSSASCWPTTRSTGSARPRAWSGWLTGTPVPARGRLRQGPGCRGSVLPDRQGHPGRRHRPRCPGGRGSGRGRRRRRGPARARVVRQRRGHAPGGRDHQRRAGHARRGREPVMTRPVTVTDRTGLSQALRQLKLSGMLATLDARLAQARAGELGHLDFLQVLCQDEISRRQSMSLARRIRRARFETEATLEGFDFAASPKLPAAQIRDLAALRWLAGGESGILYGPVGVAKSHIAQALAPLAIRAGAEARFTKTSRVLASLAGGRADRTWDK